MVDYASFWHCNASQSKFTYVLIEIQITGSQKSQTTTFITLQVALRVISYLSSASETTHPSVTYVDVLFA